jgi:hypothetical protein
MTTINLQRRQPMHEIFTTLMIVNLAAYKELGGSGKVTAYIMRGGGNAVTKAPARIPATMATTPSTILIPLLTSLPLWMTLKEVKLLQNCGNLEGGEDRSDRKWYDNSTIGILTIVNSRVS